MPGEYDLGGLGGMFGEASNSLTPELSSLEPQTPSTYSWSDFFTPENSSKISDRWEPDQFLDLLDYSPFDLSKYTFTSLPYREGEGYIADIQTPSFEGFRPVYSPNQGATVFEKVARNGWFTDNNNLPYRQYNQKWAVPVGERSDSLFQRFLDQAVPLIAGGMVTGGLGGGLAGAFGGGALGSAAGYGLAGGTTAEIQGGDFGKGFLGGAVSGGIQGLAAGTPAVMGNNPSAYVPATPGSSLAGAAGITNPTLAKMFNRGVGGTLGSLASGNSGSDALKSGLTGAALSGINSVGKSVMNPYIESFKSWLGTDTSGGDAEFDALQGSGGDMSMQTDVSPNRYDEFLMGPDGMETYNPDYRFGGDQMMDSFSSPDQSVQSSTGQPNFSLQSVLGDVGSRVGNYALNNVGDLASMLYGFYNNRRQQRQLQQPMNNMSNQVNQATTQLQNMFTQNSPYAQQLRAKLNAQAAQAGRRSNTAGRETQFQAMLAEKAASTLPQIANMQNSLMQNQLQMQQRRGQLQSSLGSNTISLLGKMGAFNGLANMFGPSTSTIPYNNGNVSGSDMFGWKGSGGM